MNVSIYCKVLVIIVFAYLFQISTLGQEINKQKPFANPALIYGSDFLTIFQIYYKQGNWDKLMALTSRTSIKRYGYNMILNHYKKMDFGYSLKLVSMKKTPEGYEMNYRAIIQATDLIVRCKVVVEKDTCRLMLPYCLNSKIIYWFNCPI